MGLQALQHIVGSQPSRHHDGQAAARELIDHAQHAERSAILGPILDEVVGPDMVGRLWIGRHSSQRIEQMVADVTICPLKINQRLFDIFGLHAPRPWKAT